MVLNNSFDGVRQVSGLRRDPAVSVEDLSHFYLFHFHIYVDFM